MTQYSGHLIRSFVLVIEIHWRGDCSIMAEQAAVGRLREDLAGVRNAEHPNY